MLLKVGFLSCMQHYQSTSCVLCCDVCCDFCIKTMFGSSLPPVVCRRAYIVFTVFVLGCA